MATVSFDEFLKKAGATAQDVQSNSTVPTSAEASQIQPGYIQRVTSSIGMDLNNRADRFGQILNRPNTPALEKGVQAFGQGAGAAANAIESTVNEIPGVKQALGAVGSGINWLATSDLSPIKHLGDLIGSSNALQEVVHLYDTDKNFRDTIDGVANIARLGGDVSAVLDGAAYTKNVTNKIVDNVKVRTASDASTGVSLPAITAPKSSTISTAKSVASDLMPTSERFVNTEVTKALDLTQGDVKNIYASTGNESGRFLADQNLIGRNVPETVKNIDEFYKTNYTNVRSEIGKVTKVFDKNELPAYRESLQQIKRQVDGVVGLTDVQAEVDSLLSKNKFTLNDVQRAKELLDEHFSLYKVTGDVKEGVVKTGLVNLRKELQKFVEDKVKKTTGADIRTLNNNVQTSRSLKDAIETRSTRGLTRASISAGDVVTFLSASAFGSPFAGVAAVIVKKIYQSPSFKLKVSKWLDGLSDARKLKVQQDLKNGIVPKELEELQSAPPNNQPNSNTEPTSNRSTK